MKTTATRTLPVIVLAFAWMLLLPMDAQAYIGPGAGITAIGALLAFVVGIIFAVIGFVWYPAKRLVAMVRGRNAGRGEIPRPSNS